ncbi:prolyl-tRNA synthetase [Thamnocephalis sphaerospora]|uniref:Probable proline--tRNA ligase, mitochondrial n=1 Tax=Thamnocephalis sphaerospora TaxID=78915 RepID=A0A4P9XVF9_9FUNG|nr:prolyl-tRNA synthetase [Thamnocephalis sphaerospora]|eukprot:RKP10002.1 prolyl-tRNA synthetase [Thamnocephalis sphaerospora]
MTSRAALSRLFVPTSKDVSASARVASHQLMLRAGLIRQSASGVYSLLPFAVRALGKLERIIDEEMETIGANKLSLPGILSADAWRKTGRWDTMGTELFRLSDRKESAFCLAPTHEEEVTQLIAAEVSSYRQLPLRLYQIGRKYRDELRPRSGLLRAREFVMKDLYTFDADEAAAMETYDTVVGAYRRIFNRIGVPYAIAEADTGQIGGKRSHEFHFCSDAGEDTLLSCTHCGYTANEELAQGIHAPTAAAHTATPSQQQKAPINDAPRLSARRAIEVGHTFLLGDKYSRPLEATYQPVATTSTGATTSAQVPIQMGCYGLGVTRALAAIAQATHDEHGLRWPWSIAPYRVCVIPLQLSGKNTAGDEQLLADAQRLQDQLETEVPGLRGEVVLDDRRGLSPGWRLKDAELIGYPWLVVLGRAWARDGRVELQRRWTREREDVSIDVLKERLRAAAQAADQR